MPGECPGLFAQDLLSLPYRSIRRLTWHMHISEAVLLISREGEGPIVKEPSVGAGTSTRWAGTAIALSGCTLLITISLYGALYGTVSPADPVTGVTSVDRANHLLESWGPLSRIWIAEVVAYLLMATGAMVLMGKTDRGWAAWPRQAAWAAVAAGALLQMVMYAFMLGGYVAAIPAAQEAPALLDAMNRAARVLFNISNAAVLFGFGAAFVSEAIDGDVLSRGVGWTGGAICWAGMGLLLLVVAGHLSLVAAAPFALIAHGFMAYFGFRLARFTAKG